MDSDDTTLLQLLTRMDDRLARMEEHWRFVIQRLDRTDETHAGISRTLQRLTNTLEQQTQVLERQTLVLERLETTLERWLALHSNGQTP